MVWSGALPLALLICLISVPPATGEHDSYLVIAPQSPVLAIGTNFTATCMIINTDEVTADDLYWKLSDTVVPTELYTRVNRSALSVTIPITDEKFEWLYCRCKQESIQNSGKFIHGIKLTKSYMPEKPQNLSCMAVQKNQVISPIISCQWDPVGHNTEHDPTTYTLNVQNMASQKRNVSLNGKNATVNLETFPNHLTLDIWVEARNNLAMIESEHLIKDAGWFVKTSPPSNVTVMSEKNFPTSLVIKWTHPIAVEYQSLTYQIRFCQSGSQTWTYVPLVDTDSYIQSFRLQKLQPDTVYVIQVCCKNARPGHGYWSNWSTNATTRTPEDKPASKPSLWRIITEGSSKSERQVKFICKDPVFSNGRILAFDIKIKDLKDKAENGSEGWERIPVRRLEADSSSRQSITELKQIDLPNKKSVQVFVTAVNSVGISPEASLVITHSDYDLPSVQGLKVWSDRGQLWVEWKSPKNKLLPEYVVEWDTNGVLDWQRENRHTRRVAIKDNLKKFVCYTISVYPIYSGRAGKPASGQIFLEEGVPEIAPAVRVKGRPGHNYAELEWDEIPQAQRRGFLTQLTISYASQTESRSVPVSVNSTSYTLRSLSRETLYEIWITASTAQGSTKGNNHSFTTLKYGPGEIEGIVVGVSFGFLFIVLMAMLLCIYKKDVIKKNFWPRIPNPGESTIGNWSPDYPLKAETPKENCLSGISVLDVDVCDGKCVFEEDKASLPLKKDKYMSEEHSSGIGGSSCMSSPRQSVSDSDEGGDLADTTASTIQYSSVVASNGYKGQTPSSQPQQAIFSRSESTQPLLDSEENPDMLLHEGSRQSQRFPRQPCFTHTAHSTDSTHAADSNQLELERQGMLEPLDFFPLEEDSEQTTPTDSQSADWLPAAPASSYMPQLGGYRPQ